MKTLIPSPSSAARVLVLGFAAAAQALSSVSAQEANGTNGASGAEGATSTAVRAPIVAVVGASVSEGFSLADYADAVKNPRAMVAGFLFRKVSDEEFAARMRSRGLSGMIAKAYTGGPELLSSTSEWLFQAPEQTAKRQLKVAIDGKADVVYAVDLPFWFGYGATGVSSRDDDFAAKKREARLVEQEQFFALVREHFDGTERQLIVGDYPDITGARVVINPPWIPKPPVQKELNERLYAFAAERPNLHVFPLRKLVRDVKGSGVTAQLGEKEVRIDRENGMQFDLVHTTVLGNAALAERLLGFAREVLPEALRPAEVSLEALLGGESESAPWLGRDPGKKK